MKRLTPISLCIVGVVAATQLLNLLFQFSPAYNPDPANHTHADFAVWVYGKQLDFSAEKYMSGSSNEEEEGDHPHAHLHEFLHLHDGNGHVIHRHKPGLPISEFFASIGFPMTAKCIKDDSGAQLCESGDKKWRMFVNGHGRPYDPEFVFEDRDHILLTYGADDSTEVERELALMTDDACLYSKTCPWRGEPPIEGCVADPTVPCTQ